MSMTGWKPHSGPSSASAYCRSTRGSPERKCSGCGSAGGSPGSNVAVDQQAPDLLERARCRPGPRCRTRGSGARHPPCRARRSRWRRRRRLRGRTGLRSYSCAFSVGMHWSLHCLRIGTLSVFLAMATTSPSCRRRARRAAARAAGRRPSRSTEAALRRIEAADPALGAFVDVDGDRALEQARAHRRPTTARLFAGVPIAIKANTPGRRAGHGLRRAPCWTGHRADHDAHLVRRLREEGFVIVGSTKSPEFGILPTTEPRHGGPARNPWDPDRTPGGSSGGAAAAVAVRDAPDRPRQRRRRVDPHPRRVLRARRPQAQPRPGLPRPRHRRLVPRLRRRPLPHRARHGRGARRARRATRPATPPGRRRPTAVHHRRQPRPGLAAHPRRARRTRSARRPAPGERGGASRDGASARRPRPRGRGRRRRTCPAPETLPLFLDVFAANIALGDRARAAAGGPRGRAGRHRAAVAGDARAAPRARTRSSYLGAIAPAAGARRRVVALWADCDVHAHARARRAPAAHRRARPASATADAELRPRRRPSPRTPALFNVTGQPAITVPAGFGADGLPVRRPARRPPAGRGHAAPGRRASSRPPRPWAHVRPPAALAPAPAARPIGSGRDAERLGVLRAALGEHRRAHDVGLVAGGQRDRAGDRLVERAAARSSERRRDAREAPRAAAGVEHRARRPSRAVSVSGPAISSDLVAVRPAVERPPPRTRRRRRPTPAGSRARAHRLGHRARRAAATSRSSSAQLACPRARRSASSAAWWWPGRRRPPPARRAPWCGARGERWCGDAPRGDEEDEVLDARALGRAQQAPGGHAVDLLDRRVGLVALRGREVDDGPHAAQRVAEGRRVAEVAERDLHADALRAEAPRVADQAADRVPGGPTRRRSSADPTRPVAPVSRSIERGG